MIEDQVTEPQNETELSALEADALTKKVAVTPVETVPVDVVPQQGAVVDVLVKAPAQTPESTLNLDVALIEALNAFDGLDDLAPAAGESIGSVYSRGFDFSPFEEKRNVYDIDYFSDRLDGRDIGELDRAPIIENFTRPVVEFVARGFVSEDISFLNVVRLLEAQVREDVDVDPAPEPEPNPEPEQVFDQVITGDAGNNDLQGDNGADQIFGLDGDDDLRGKDGEDELHGGAGDDYLQGQDDDDVLYGDDGNDRLKGNNGDDSLYGGAGDDSLQGGNGEDVLFGGAGADILKGENGDDVLHGGGGTDELRGGNGDDVFVWQVNDVDGSLDVVFDFKSGNDKIDLSDILSDSNLPIDQLVQFTNGNHTILSVSMDGSGDANSFVNVAQFQGDSFGGNNGIQYSDIISGISL